MSRSEGVLGQLYIRVHQAAAVTRHELGRIIGEHPVLFDLCYRWRPAHRNRVVGRNTDICIEGFPRSANSFAVGALRRAQSQVINVAHHTHRPAAVLQAVRRNVPVVVLIRDPVDAIVSYRGLELQVHRRSSSSRPPVLVPFSSLLRRWISFYERLIPILDQVVVGRFEVVTQEYGAIIERVNDRFGTDFVQSKPGTEVVQEISEKRGYHALPSEEREHLKNKARLYFRSEIGEDSYKVHQARDIHEHYKAS